MPAHRVSSDADTTHCRTHLLIQLSSADASTFEQCDIPQMYYASFFLRLVRFEAACVAAVLAADGQLAAVLRQAAGTLAQLQAPQPALPETQRLLRLSVSWHVFAVATAC